ncbi:DUF7257 domain-containing protein [Nocardia brasiliensis]|uniref:DUF7257 domain-containing protein n=1 Tax=Nocardia brasiliensis TaxID=37326 RepID=UPI0024549079|nr:hypothetical protein [Nocardia brasiliensis]
MLPFPGPDARTARFPGPDARAAPFSGPDVRLVQFPPIPRSVVEQLALAVGGGIASVVVVIVPWRRADALGGGMASVVSTSTVAVAASALGGGLATAIVVNAEIKADALGGGIAEASVVAGITGTAQAVGGGLAGVLGRPVASITAVAIAAGAGTATLTPGALIAATANGGGVATVANTVTPVVSAAALGGGVASAAVLVGYRWSDAFNRVNAATLGPDWRLDRNAQPKIDTFRAQMKTMASGDGRSGNWVSWQGGGGAAAGRFGTDRYAVKAQLIAPVGNAATDNFTGVILAVADTFGAGTMCYVVVSTGLGCAIYTQAGLPPTSGVSTGQTGQAQQAVTATNIVTTDLIEFRRLPAAVGTVFTLYRNGAEFLSWPDTGNVVSSGPSFRRWGLFTEGNYPLFQSEFRAPAVDAIVEARDL